MKARAKIIIIFTVLTLLPTGFAQADLADQIDQIISRSLQQKVRFSIHIIEADSGDTVYEHNAEELMMPASNMKIIITAAALKYLGADYEYKTKVGLCGNTLVITGSGDPLLGDEKTDSGYGRGQGWIFEEIAKELRKNEVQSIEDIIIDTGVFDNQCVHPNWPSDQLNRWYACEVSGLNYNDNCIRMSTRNIDGKVAIIIEPQTSFVKLINKVAPITTGDSAVGAYRNQQPNKLTVRGKCKDQVGPFDVAIEKPAAFFGFLLAEHLNKTGIKVTGRLTEKITSEKGDFRPLTEFTTPISDCLLRCNKDSLGLAAEALLKTIAAKNNPGGKNGSWQKGRELVGEYLEGLGIEENRFYIDDGSGLSRENRLSARIITKVLLNIYNSDDWEIYKNSLAVGGVDGTIDDHFRDEKYKGKIYGKTGYISGVKSFSGICVTARGNYIFSILTNNANGPTRTAINNIAKAIIDKTDDTIQ